VRAETDIVVEIGDISEGRSKRKGWEKRSGFGVGIREITLVEHVHANGRFHYDV
jgi:hypothetical protein